MKKLFLLFVSIPFFTSCVEYFDLDDYQNWGTLEGVWESVDSIYGSKFTLAFNGHFCELVESNESETTRYDKVVMTVDTMRYDNGIKYGFGEPYFSGNISFLYFGEQEPTQNPFFTQSAIEGPNSFLFHFRIEHFDSMTLKRIRNINGEYVTTKWHRISNTVRTH